MNNWPFAAVWADLDVGGIREIVTVALRGFVAVVAAFLIWIVSGPLLRLLYRAATRRPAPGWAVGGGRLASAVLVGLLVFWYLPLGGGGGSGWGLFGGGGGSGTGPGKGGPGEGTGTGKEKTTKETREGKEVLLVELIVPRPGVEPDGRFYLVGGKEPPRKLEEIDKLLQENQGRFGQMEIRCYANTPAEESRPVRDLKALAVRRGLTPVVPAEYLDKERSP
jgi:hypothetical protein